MAEDTQTELERLRTALKQAESVQDELDRRVFYLKTLYDVSKDIFGSVATETILKNFLLMSMGNFGVTEGFILLLDPDAKTIDQNVSFGMDKHGLERASQANPALFDWGQHAAADARVENQDIFPETIAFVLPFEVEADCLGVLGLGAKLIGDAYSSHDRELLDTLINNLVVALKNARAFEEIKNLNEDLAAKNIALEKALSELKAALRKVELLESIKANLCKFVPTTVTKLVEISPTGDALTAKERDVTVLFLDIEGYSKITETVGGTEVNTLIERYFSVFMDAIYENNGDVVETAGDGLMVLFLTEDEVLNALEAVRAAKTIQEKACRVNGECTADSQPVVINIGICSGEAFVGAAKFESITGSRWAYTSHGTTINVAARICGLATGGAVLASRTTMERTQDQFSFEPLGKFALKNLTEEVEVYKLIDG